MLYPSVCDTSSFLRLVDTPTRVMLLSNSRSTFQASSCKPNKPHGIISQLTDREFVLRSLSFSHVCLFPRKKIVYTCYADCRNNVLDEAWCMANRPSFANEPCIELDCERHCRKFI
jgi:hypothetical protein